MMENSNFFIINLVIIEIIWNAFSSLKYLHAWK